MTAFRTMAGRLTLTATAIAALVAAAPARADDCDSLRRELVSLRQDIAAGENATKNYMARLQQLTQERDRALERYRPIQKDALSLQNIGIWQQYRAAEDALLHIDRSISPDELGAYYSFLHNGRQLKDRKNTVVAAMSVIDCPENAPSPQRTAVDEVDALPIDDSLKEYLKGLRKTDPERYKENMKGFKPAPSATASPDPSATPSPDASAAASPSTSATPSPAPSASAAPLPPPSPTVAVPGPSITPPQQNPELSWEIRNRPPPTPQEIDAMQLPPRPAPPAGARPASACDELRAMLVLEISDAKEMLQNQAMHSGTEGTLTAMIDQRRGRARQLQDAMNALGCPDISAFPGDPPPPPPAQPVSTPPSDELDGFPEDIKDDLRRLKGTDPERYRERIKRLRPQVPAAPSTPPSTTVTLAPLPPAIVGLGGVGVIPPIDNSRPPAPLAPLPPMALNTPPNLTPPTAIPPATPTGIPSSPDRRLKKITTICQQGAGARDDQVNTPYKCRKVDHVCQPGTKGPNCPPWMHTTETIVCSTWRAKPEQGDTATCQPMACNIPSNGILAGADTNRCTPAIDPSYTGLKSAVLPIQPLPPPDMSHTPAVLPPPVLPPPQIASMPRDAEHVQEPPKKKVSKRPPPQPKKYVNRRPPEPQGQQIDPAVANALIGIAVGIATGAMRSGGGGRGGPPPAMPSGHR